MPDFEEQASVHPDTVEKYSKGELAAPSRRNVRRVKNPQDPGYYIKVDEKAWEVAMDIAGGDALRIEVISERELIVWNNRNWKNKPSTYTAADQRADTAFLVGVSYGRATPNRIEADALDAANARAQRWKERYDAACVQLDCRWTTTCGFYQPTTKQE